MIYVVLGMHKSGTTLVARLLHESGIHMGDFEDHLSYGDGNVCERHETQAANRALLHGLQLPPLDYLLKRHRLPPVDAAGYARNSDSRAWVLRRALERRMRRPDASRSLRRVALACEDEHADWGFKDPRTCLTYAAWRRALPPHRIVAVFRGLGQVLERSRQSRRHPLRALRLARAWTLYNAMIAQHLETTDQPWLALRYGELMAGDATLKRLAEFVGRPLSDVRDPGLHRTRGEAPIPGWVRAARPLLAADPVALEARITGLVS